MNIRNKSQIQFLSFASESSRIICQMDSSPLPDNIDSETENGVQETQEENTCCDRKGKRKAGSGGSSHPTTRKKSTTRSEVWEHYTRTKDDRDKCRCNHCQRIFGCASSQGTSNLKKHLLSCKSHLAWKQSQAPGATVITNDGGLTNAKVSDAVFREATNELLVLAELPLSFTESVAWRYFCDRTCLYKPHSRRTATRDIVQMYVRKKEALKNWFKVSRQRVSLTTDIWTANPTGASYMVVTVHFVDDSWQLRKLIIGFKHVCDHRGQTIAAVLLECLAEWAIQKVFTITVDNATANTSALRKFQSEFILTGDEALVLDGNFMHMRCAAHIINLVVRDGLQDIDENVEAIRNAVQYVRSSTQRQKSFQLRVESGKMSRGSLPLDIKTRWNSTYLMLQRAIKFKVAFDKMEQEDKLYNDFFNEVENGNKRIGPPAIVDWNAVERLVKFLIIFYNSTLVVSASTSVSSHLCYGEIVTIERNLIRLCQSLDKELKSKADGMKAKFEKYWDGMKNVNKMVIVASVFDPTKKMQFAKLCFEKLYGKETTEAKEMYQSVHIVLIDMFKEYSLRFKKDSTGGQSSQSTQASSSNGQDQDQGLGENIEEAMDLVDDLGYERMDFAYTEMVAEIGVEEARDELELYLKEKVENPKSFLGTEYDVLAWWRLNCQKYPILAEMAKDILAMQVSSVASESAFSTSASSTSFPHQPPCTAPSMSSSHQRPRATLISPVAEPQLPRRAPYTSSRAQLSLHQRPCAASSTSFSHQRSYAILHSPAAVRICPFTSRCAQLPRRAPYTSGRAQLSFHQRPASSISFPHKQSNASLPSLAATRSSLFTSSSAQLSLHQPPRAAPSTSFPHQRSRGTPFTRDCVQLLRQALLTSGRAQLSLHQRQRATFPSPAVCSSLGELPTPTGAGSSPFTSGRAQLPRRASLISHRAQLPRRAPLTSGRVQLSFHQSLSTVPSTSFLHLRLRAALPSTAAVRSFLDELPSPASAHNSPFTSSSAYLSFHQPPRAALSTSSPHQRLRAALLSPVAKSSFLDKLSSPAGTRSSFDELPSPAAVRISPFTSRRAQSLDGFPSPDSACSSPHQSSCAALSTSSFHHPPCTTSSSPDDLPS
ncbi:hypothetical protein N665_4139s0001 [Sinapis alba]|nr:hypothetical protein N665_4139s0001 [Sinapis alba]